MDISVGRMLNIERWLLFVNLLMLNKGAILCRF
jgi:hypothetical protein